MTESVAVRKARITAQWRMSRWRRLKGLESQGATSDEAVEEAWYLYEMAALDLEEACERQAGGSPGWHIKEAPGSVPGVPRDD